MRTENYFLSSKWTHVSLSAIVTVDHPPIDKGREGTGTVEHPLYTSHSPGNLCPLPLLLLAQTPQGHKWLVLPTWDSERFVLTQGLIALWWPNKHLNSDLSSSKAHALSTMSHCISWMKPKWGTVQWATQYHVGAPAICVYLQSVVHIL